MPATKFVMDSIRNDDGSWQDGYTRRRIKEISAEDAARLNGGVTRRSIFESCTMTADRKADRPNIWTVTYLDGSERTFDARTDSIREAQRRAESNAPYTVDELYSRYVGWGFADTDGYYAPISRDAFARQTRDAQLRSAEIPANDPRR